MFMKVEKIVQYKTEDGKYFDTLDEALRYANIADNQEKFDELYEALGLNVNADFIDTLDIVLTDKDTRAILVQFIRDYEIRVNNSEAGTEA